MKQTLQLSKQQVINLWFHCQGLTYPRGTETLTKKSLVGFLNKVGAVQLDSVNVLERAHYLTLWSRFGIYDKGLLDSWIYADRVAYEYWGHEASLLPFGQLPNSKRRMRNFPPPSWENSSWWQRFNTSDTSKRRVLRRLKKDGVLESRHFEKQKNESTTGGGNFSDTLLNAKEDKRSLLCLWHAGKTAISARRHFRRHYDLSVRVYPECSTATTKAYEESWLINGLIGNGAVSLSHLNNYFTAPVLRITQKREIIQRFLRTKKIIPIKVEGLKEAYYILPEHLNQIDILPEPRGTNIICPFDSLLWQRKRALELLDFQYKIEIYVPPQKRIYGYYLMPVLHNGRLVGRIDPKYHRDKGELEILSRFHEEWFTPGKEFEKLFRKCVEELALFVGARNINPLPKWKIKK